MRGRVQRLIKKIAHQENATDECNNDEPLRAGRFLDWLPRVYLANLAGAVLRFFTVYQAVNFAGQANAKHRFKK